MNKTVKIALIAMIMLASISTASGAVTYLFLMNKTASMSVTLNTFRIELYKEETNPSTVITNLAFPSLLVNSPNNASKTDVMYLFTQQTPKTYTLKWSCSDLPTGFTLKAYWNLAGTGYYEWIASTDLNVALVAPSSGNSGMRLYFQMEAIGALSLPQDYHFSVQILAGE
jgi:hypothetical protein